MNKNTKSNKDIKTLMRKENIGYFFDYYKVHTFTVIVVLFILGNILNVKVINPQPQIILNVSILSKYIDEDEKEKLEESLKKFFVTNSKKEDVLVSHFTVGENVDPLLQQAISIKMVSPIYSNELDVFIVEEEFFEELALQGYFYPLDILLETDQLVVSKDNYIYAQMLLENGNLGDKSVYGIKHTRYNKLINTNKSVIIDIVSNTERINKSLVTVNELVK